MTSTAGMFAIPKITWGSSYQNTLFFNYPLFDWVTRSEALEGSQFLRIESGYEDSWIVNTSYVLEATVRFIEQDDWDTNWIPFLEWARKKNTFKWYPNVQVLTGNIISYLVEPLTEAPTIEPDGTRTIRLVIRNTTTPYEIEEHIPSSPPGTNTGLLPSGSFPSGNLVLFLDTSYFSYPGTGDTWYDISGNNLHFNISGSGTHTFNRTSGWSLNTPGSGFSASSAVTQIFDSFWPLGAPVTNSLAVAVVVTPQPNCCIGQESTYFGYWDVTASPESQYKMTLGQNLRNPVSGTPVGVRGMTLEAAIDYSGSNPGDIFHFTNNSSTGFGQLPSGSESFVIWQLEGTTSVITKNITGSMGANTNPPSTGDTIPSGALWDLRYDTSADLRIGTAYTGEIRAVAVYNRPLTNDEKIQLNSYYKSLLTYNPGV